MDSEEKRPVELVRVAREERFFAVEDVLGRDAASVFPTESRKAMLDSEPVKALLSENRKFISESELHEIQVAAGGRRRVEDGSVAADKPLVEVLREAREAKESKFQEQWKQMKTGKNRPLDEDELEFLERVAEAEAQRQRRVAEEEEAELETYHQALRQQEEARAAAAAAKDAADAAAGPGPGGAGPVVGPSLLPSGRPALAAARRLGRPAAVVIRPKRQVATHRPGVASGGAAAALDVHDAKKRRAEGAAQASGDGDGGLPGLLGDYASDSDS